MLTLKGRIYSLLEISLYIRGLSMIKPKQQGEKCKRLEIAGQDPESVRDGKIPGSIPELF